MGERWVKLYEKIEDSSIYKDSELVHLWVHLIIKASKFGNTFPWNDGEIKLRPGQLITGRKKLHNQTGISESKIQRALKRFEKCHMIEQQTTNKYRLITIVNWHMYQTSEQQMDSNRTGNEQVTNNERTSNEHNQESIESKKEEYYLTRKKRKLSGKRLITFLKFWEAFDYKKDKASAADSWIDIPELTDRLVSQICDAAKKEAQRRPGKITAGQTPIFAQGWLTARRWEDEEENINNQIDTDGSQAAKERMLQTQRELYGE
jgi:DNA-binding transcriptional MocR family regulator